MSDKTTVAGELPVVADAQFFRGTLRVSPRLGAMQVFESEGVYPLVTFNAATAALAQKDGEIDRLREALESVWLWMENQADGQSKGGHATFDLMALREQRDIARAALGSQA